MKTWHINFTVITSGPSEHVQADHMDADVVAPSFDIACKTIREEYSGAFSTVFIDKRQQRKLELMNA